MRRGCHGCNLVPLGTSPATLFQAQRWCHALAPCPPEQPIGLMGPMCSLRPAGAFLPLVEQRKIETYSVIYINGLRRLGMPTHSYRRCYSRCGINTPIGFPDPSTGVAQPAYLTVPWRGPLPLRAQGPERPWHRNGLQDFVREPLARFVGLPLPSRGPIPRGRARLRMRVVLQAPDSAVPSRFGQAL